MSVFFSLVFGLLGIAWFLAAAYTVPSVISLLAHMGNKSRPLADDDKLKAAVGFPLALLAGILFISWSIGLFWLTGLIALTGAGVLSYRLYNRRVKAIGAARTW